jgi:ABC-2 type transport system ATP-binding protein
MSANRFAVEARQISKSFNGRKVVDDLSFDVGMGEIFGLIGPNGAGKTTSIRMMLDIVKPDSGQVEVLGKRLDERTKDIIGYLPEERGLYRKSSVLDSVVFLATLKGMDAQRAKERGLELLRRVNLESHRAKKAEELSRGMAQILQFVVTIVHRPRLVVLDEPFANLDPLNTELMKQMIDELRKEGTAIILSTHRMDDVEELCDRVLMVNQGRRVLYGSLKEIKSRFLSDSVLLEYDGQLGSLIGVVGRHVHGKATELLLDGRTEPRQVLAQLVAQQITINRFEIGTPSLQEIFVRVVRDGP